MNNPERVTKKTRGRRRKPILNFDLNDVAPYEGQTQEGPSARAMSQDQQAGQQGDAGPEPIDLEAYDDDDVIICSPGAFSEAKNNSRRNRGRTVVVDIESDERPSRNKRRRISTNRTIINCDVYVNLEGNSNNTKNAAQSGPPLLAPSPPKEPKFSCPVCMGLLVEETSTKCGHIFCKACIKTAIAAQGKCPTCRRKITMKDTFRIYLPATTSA